MEKILIVKHKSLEDFYNKYILKEDKRRDSRVVIPQQFYVDKELLKGVGQIEFHYMEYEYINFNCRSNSNIIYKVEEYDDVNVVCNFVLTESPF